jgi:uncharacterized protein
MADKESRLPKSTRRAWVTGASTGIGAAFARRLAADHYDLALVARSRDRLEELATTLEKDDGVTCAVLPADLTDAKDLERIAAAIAGDNGAELLINNAGFGTIGPYAKLDFAREEDEVRLNVIALMRLTRAALPGLIERGRGAIINVSSMAAFQPAPLNATYGATKAFVNSFTESLSEELRGSGVHVMALCPGFTRTEFQERAGIDTSGIPGFAWMSAEAVVDSALAALRRGDVVSVPGAANRVVATAVGAMPRAAVRRISGLAVRRFLK